MKKLLLLIFLSNAIILFSQETNLSFSSSDRNLNEVFEWAKTKALSFAHDGKDPVGFWYEAALPNREAFCMRDIAHQTIGGEILGLSSHNYNMMMKFAENISESKDWCTYWEINRYNKPAPVDYVNNEQFWSTLPANFDVMQACLKLYEWTGNKEYLYNPVIVNFYEKSVNEFISRWMLEPENLLIRPTFMNTELPIKKDAKFNGCRGIPSYVETEGGFSVAADLVSAMYSGFKAYSKICKLRSELDKSKVYELKAEAYKAFLNEKFWDSDKGHYNFFWSCVEGDFLNTECQGETYIVWFDAASTPQRSKTTIDRVLKMDCNVENRSHYPSLLYRYRMPKQAYENIIILKDTERKNYPEVSYGVMEGLIGGLMGIKPMASQNVVMTLPQLNSESDWVEIKGLNVLSNNVNIKHLGSKKTAFTNNSENEINWRAAFYGEYKKLYLNGKTQTPNYGVDKMGNIYSYVDVSMKKDKTYIVNL